MKVMNNLVLEESKHLLEKITCRICNFYNFKKKNSHGLISLLEQSQHQD